MYIYLKLKSSFRKCKSCRERYSTTQNHHVKDDLGIALNCDFIVRAATTKEYVPESEEFPAHYVFSDGVGRDSIENTSVGCLIFLTPGKSKKQYETCESDSPAR